ncbi:Cell division inhibitor [Mycobacterium intracellulare subsp. yongonense]|nr:Cell division inhibitor [Mycobacterium intracellulare subsp. yongonense]
MLRTGLVVGTIGIYPSRLLDCAHAGQTQSRRLTRFDGPPGW